MSPSTDESEAVRIVRSIAVPAEKVYDAFVNPEQLLRWIGPEGYSATEVEMDPTVGGSADISIIRGDEDAGSFHWEFIEMDPPRRLVFSFAFGGPGGELEAHRSRMTLEFREQGPEATELTLVHDRLGAAPPGGHVGVTTGWTQALVKLVQYLEEGEAGNT
ncbi:MAG TPA: SRPBCC domain-containing protein [Solirubrobacterales bacterium]|nr:SRPBCC domain-containing protein [Solirubrobacterales bacterium]